MNMSAILLLFATRMIIFTHFDKKMRNMIENSLNVIVDAGERRKEILKNAF